MFNNGLSWQIGMAVGGVYRFVVFASFCGVSTPTKAVSNHVNEYGIGGKLHAAGSHEPL